jgi:hypothetical protein
MKHRISEIGVQMLEYQEQLAREHKYKPIPRTFFCDVRAEFQKALPEWCNISGDTTPLETTDGTIIANGYNRIVIGDYGAFVEFSRVQAYMRRLKIKEGQVYRIEDPRYAEHVKYLWLTANDSSDVKVYEQKRPVEYADYKPGMLYVSVYEVFPHI